MENLVLSSVTVVTMRNVHRLMEHVSVHQDLLGRSVRNIARLERTVKIAHKDANVRTKQSVILKAVNASANLAGLGSNASARVRFTLMAKDALRLATVSTTVDVTQHLENAIAAQVGQENHARRNATRGSSAKTVPSNAFVSNPRRSHVTPRTVDAFARLSIVMAKRLNTLA